MSMLPVPQHPMYPAMPVPGATMGVPLDARPAVRFDLRFLTGIVRRRWLLLSSTILAITAGVVVHAVNQETVFEASAKIMIGMPNAPAIDLANLVTGMPVTTERIQNEVQLLQSRSLARKVVVAAGLDLDPEYNPALRPADETPSLISQVKALIPSRAELSALLGLDAYLPAAETADAGAASVDPLRPVIDAFLGDLTVWPEGRSHVINVSFEAKNPVRAAAVANALAETYLEDRLSTKLETSERASGWLEERIAALRVDAERKEAAVEAFRSEAGLVAGEGAGLVFERIAELNRELAVAKAAEVQALARYDKARDTLRSEGSDAVPEVLGSPTVQQLRASEAVALATQAELGRDLGARHPRMMDIRAQLQSIRAQIAIETRRVLDSLENQYEVARSRTDRIEAEMDALESRIRDRNDGEAQLRVLERGAEAAQEVYRTFLMRANSSGHQEGIETADGRLISAAEVPRAPVGPNRRLLVILGFAFACCVAFALALGRELLDRRFRTADQIRARLNVPVVGVVPMLRSLSRTRSTPQDHVVEGPDSAFGEAIRSLRTSLTMTSDGPPPRSLLFTSSVPAEGKTTLSLAVGRHSALSGLKTIVIDCDFRRPRVHAGLGAPNGPGVIDYLRGSPLTEIVRVDQRTGLHFLTAGTWQQNAPELLRLPRMGELISLLHARYDLVLIDTPPLLPVWDAGIIAGLADLAVLVVGYTNARPETVDAAAQRLRQAAGKARIAAIFNNVDVRKVAGYGSAEADVYRSGYDAYYAAA